MPHDNKNIGDRQLEPVMPKVDMEKFSCECDKNCDEYVTEGQLVTCPTCKKYISFRCIETHINEKH